MWITFDWKNGFVKRFLLYGCVEIKLSYPQKEKGVVERFQKCQ
ncbi:hypothetical protein CHK_0875 [Christensenella hongkongensis]|uniref:Uncharacterized protein n=1 Tax=Christensenella hongkongensis TaxID=270498 RepID=A0A0M2NHR3_9FIRM|nr:hypothetical protein CHK_0875 [Christensenella hongkongensis]